MISLLTMVSLQGYSKEIPYEIKSPDSQIKVSINIGKVIAYRVSFKNKNVLESSELSLSLNNGNVLGVKSELKSITKKNVDENVTPLFGRAKIYKNVYNEVTFSFKNNYQLIFRVFNNGVAYRFRTSLPDSIEIKSEQINYHFNNDVSAWLQKTSSFNFSYEKEYLHNNISTIGNNEVAALPLVVESAGIKIAITESDVLDYPGYYLKYSGNNTLTGVSPKFVLKDSIGGQENFNKLPYQYANYIAKTSGNRSFPWRLMIIAEHDKDLLLNNLVYLLASENKIGDASWIKPGKVAWDWWNAMNLTGVDFKTGINTETYKYFIDFAAQNKIEYILMDEGWSDQFDLLKVNDGSIATDGTTKYSGKLDMSYIFEYAKQKGVGIILWCVWHTLDRQMKPALDQFQKWGVKGVKVDFMNRDDQGVVNFYERLAKEAAKHHLIIDFHAAYKPTGLDRTYPNILNYEAVQGLEWNKFSNVDILSQATILPYTRMLAGPMDYTPGGMDNANQEDFRKRYYRPMTQGTRCNQLAMFTLFYAPFEMMADAPTVYEKEPEILSYLSGMPTVWDDTIPLEGKIGDYAVIARKKGDIWYVAGLNNWNEKSVKLNFDFLEDGNYQATIFKDGVNANRIGNDYKKVIKNINSKTIMDMNMANGGGFAIRLEKVE